VEHFLRFSFILLVVGGVVFGNDFRDMKKISLKKDVQKKILVKYAQYERLFTFRWTLYINDDLVLFHSYDKRVAQNILTLNHTNQSFRVELKPRGADFFNVPYLLVKFKEFDYKKNEALFEVYLWDKREQIELKYLQDD
jgi:hypothetical protein